MSDKTDEFDDGFFDHGFEASASPMPTWKPQQAQELIETLERLSNEDILPDEILIPLSQLAVVRETRSMLAACDETLLPEFELRLDAVCSAYGDVRFCLLEEPESVRECWADLSDHCRGFIAWLKNPRAAAERKEKNGSTTPLGKKEPAPPKSVGGSKETRVNDASTTPLREKESAGPKGVGDSNCPVVLQGQVKSVFVNGQEVEPLTEKRYRVIEMLVKYHPTKVGLGTFSNNDIGDASKALREIKLLPGWESVIYLPGGKGKGGYGLLSSA